VPVLLLMVLLIMIMMMLVVVAATNDDDDDDDDDDDGGGGWCLVRLNGANLADENLGKTWAKNQGNEGKKSRLRGCKSRRINNKLD
jgi:hypothetical protein